MVLILGADKKPGANFYIRIKTNVSANLRNLKILRDFLFYREYIFSSENPSSREFPTCKIWINFHGSPSFLFHSQR